MAEYIKKEDLFDEAYQHGRYTVQNSYLTGAEAVDVEDIKKMKTIDIVKCKECKHFELNPITVIDGIPLILAHEICHFWGKGCKTSQDGFCFYGERKESPYEID